MSGCEQLDALIDGRLSSEQQAAMQSHVESCLSCRAELAAWTRTVDALRQWAAEGDSPAPPTARQQARLLADARAQRARPRRGALIGLAALAAAAALLLWWWPAQTPTPPMAVRVLYADGDAAVRQDVWSAGDGALVVGLERTRVGLARGSQVKLLRAVLGEVRIGLLRGEVAVEARPRGQLFEIDAAPYRVRVVGTRFRVARREAGLVVDVAEGVVEVDCPPHTTRVAAGRSLRCEAAKPREEALSPARAEAIDRLLLGEHVERAPPLALEASATPDASTGAMPTTSTGEALTDARATRPTRRLDAWRAWVVSGEYARAERALTEYLGAAPEDAEAWMVLADAQRKRGRWARAVRALRQAIRRGDRPLASRARYQAASLLQDRLARHDEAVALLRGYIAGAPDSDLLLPEARLRLARSLRALGQRVEADALLRVVTERHPGTGAAVRARQLLEGR